MSVPLYQSGGGSGGSGSSAWSSLTAAVSDLTLANAGFNTTFNQTSAVTWKFANTTAALVGASQSSPILKIAGRYWTGAADAEDSWTIQNVIANGANGKTELTIAHAGSTGNAAVVIPSGPPVNPPASGWGVTFSGTSIGLGAQASTLYLNTVSAYPSCRFYAGGVLKGTIGASTSSGVDYFGLSLLPTNAVGNIVGGITTGITVPGVIFAGASNFTGTAAGMQIAVGIGAFGDGAGGTVTFAPASGATNFAALVIKPTINQTGTASGSYTGLIVNAVETALLGSANLLLDLQAGVSGGVSRYSVDNAGQTAEKTANGAQWVHGQASELLTLSTAGLTTDTAANLLPANAIIEAVVCRVTTTITTTTNWAVGDATISARFSAANATLTSGTTSVGLAHVDQTGTSGPKQTASAKVRITCTGANPGAGAIRITVFYRVFVAPTS